MPLILTRDAEQFQVPERLPVLPLRDVVLFPYVVMPLLIGRAQSLAAVDAAANDGNVLFLVAQRNSDQQDPGAADLYRVGVVARLMQVVRLPNGTTKILVEGIARARVTRYATSSGALRATVAAEPFTDADAEADPSALGRRVLSQFEEYVSLHRRIPPEVVTLVQATASEERQACAVAAHVAVRHDIRQTLLEAPTLAALLGQLAQLLAAEIEILGLERKIEEDVRGSLFQNQREFYLQEQLKAIHRELGQEDDDFGDLEAAIEKKGLPEPVKARALRELRKLRRMSPLSPEATVGRNFVDWVLALPWAERTEDAVDVTHARGVLDEDHYGLVEVKERILDYIAVLSLVGRLEGPILCLVGPPGVGKTSLGRSVARALGRRFARMSLGGVRDEAEIRGHRRTYIGALPGRVIQAMRRAEVVNPVILLDEIDKLGQDYRGDPASALLEVLDPEQNRTFSDHYLEVDYDLSHVLFITTANSLATIPEPLRDRMEIIRLPGYLDQEKEAIARQFLIPKQLKQNGLDPSLVTFEPDTVQGIIHRYTREAGVRDLERRIARVARKLARRQAELAPALLPVSVAGEPAADPPPSRGKAKRARKVGTGTDAAAPAPADASPPATAAAPTPQVVRQDDLRSFLGVAPYDPDDQSLDDKVGVATGLAYTSVGGETLEVEVAVVRGRGKVQLTGTLGDVMKESASAALSYARSRAAALGIDRDFHRSRDLHVHIPAGATPKDGPSAGIAIATAVISALTGRPIRGDTAMTGEITLRGRVLPIGGLKEKSVAAHRNGIARVIIPHGNAREIEELPEEVRTGVEFLPVRTMDEVMALVLRGVTAAPQPEPVIAATAVSPAASVAH
ncbi:MAG: ATP-dependent protease La [Geminicoccaceae bacterium]|nr:ATP-dependent protease La [Geminicoccaceae bacterium]